MSPASMPSRVAAFDALIQDVVFPLAVSKALEGGRPQGTLDLMVLQTLDAPRCTDTCVAPEQVSGGAAAQQTSSSADASGAARPAPWEVAVTETGSQSEVLRDHASRPAPTRPGKAGLGPDGRHHPHTAAR
jgi:hypothetical protein